MDNKGTHLRFAAGLTMALPHLFLDFLSLAVSTALAILAICAFRLLRDGPPSWWPLVDAQNQRRYHPIGGTVFHELLHLPRLYDYLTDLSRRYRTFRLLSPYHDEIFTTDPAVVEHVLRANSANYGKGKNVDLLSRLLTETESDSKGKIKKYLRDLLLNFLGAGMDTTCGTLSWFFFMLCKNPLVQEKIVREIREETGSDVKIGFNNFANNITEESLNKMHYLHAALTETLRLYPALPMDSKVCFADETLPDGFIVRKGDVVDYQPYPMGRMKHQWGEDAEVFKPERWLDENGCFRPESPFKFTAFQAGPRICMGKEFAYRQMKIFSAVRLNFFRFKLCDKNNVIKYKITITLHMMEGLPLYAYCR